jgi:hypothetical protein
MQCGIRIHNTGKKPHLQKPYRREVVRPAGAPGTREKKAYLEKPEHIVVK